MALCVAVMNDLIGCDLRTDPADSIFETPKHVGEELPGNSLSLWLKFLCIKEDNEHVFDAILIRSYKPCTALEPGQCAKEIGTFTHFFRGPTYNSCSVVVFTLSLPHAVPSVLPSKFLYVWKEYGIPHSF